MKPNLTEEQKKSFEEKFVEIINEASPEAQKMWQDAGAKVQWLLDQPILFGIPPKLHGKLADRYVTLINNLNDRRI